MGQVYASGKRGGKPKQIDGFTGSMQIITETTTWTCPATGEYYISCIGQGGTHIFQSNSGTESDGITMGTGAGGGISESKIKLKKGNEIIITIDAGVSSFGSYLSATGGENCSITSNAKVSIAKGGAGSGGNAGNFNGIDGKTKKAYDVNYTTLQAGGTNASAKYGGATGGTCLSDSIMSVCFSTCPTTANLGMYPYGSSQGFGVYGQFDAPTYGKTGYIKNGAVIIEYMG